MLMAKKEKKEKDKIAWYFILDFSVSRISALFFPAQLLTLMLESTALAPSAHFPVMFLMDCLVQMSFSYIAYVWGG